MTRKELGLKILAAIENREDWYFTDYVAIHLPSKVEIWIANGWESCHIYAPTKIGKSFTFWHKIKIFNQLADMKRKVVAKKVDDNLKQALAKLDEVLVIPSPEPEPIKTPYMPGQWA